jgi:FtsP/CotA-like multicopper oxidase with cupredoxin domain
VNSINRRSVLLAGLGAAGTGLLAACSSDTSNSPALLSPSGSQVARTGRVHRLNLTAAPGTLDLGGGISAKSWAFSGRVPGKEIRISAGDTLAAELSNQLPGQIATSLHWHGIALRSDMDGVPPLTQTGVRAGSAFTYRFIADAPGTYFFHPHVGVQLDRGLHAPLIVEDDHPLVVVRQRLPGVLDDQRRVQAAVELDADVRVEEVRAGRVGDEPVREGGHGRFRRRVHPLRVGRLVRSRHGAHGRNGHGQRRHGRHDILAVRLP